MIYLKLWHFFLYSSLLFQSQAPAVDAGATGLRDSSQVIPYTLPDPQPEVLAEDSIPVPDCFPVLHSDPYHSAWADSARPLLIDAYYLNDIDWEALGTDPRVVGILHKASQGQRTDPQYLQRRDTAKNRGFLWGSYHLGKPGDPVGQARFYLETVGHTEDEVLALDLEGLDREKFMGLEEAVEFIQFIYDSTGRYPLVYCNHRVMEAIGQEYGGESIFANCPLWYARFRSEIPNFDNPTWNRYTLWQFSSEINCRQKNRCLYNVAGTDFDMDVNVFYGSRAELLHTWPVLNQTVPCRDSVP